MKTASQNRGCRVTREGWTEPCLLTSVIVVFHLHLVLSYYCTFYHFKCVSGMMLVSVSCFVLSRVWGGGKHNALLLSCFQVQICGFGVFPMG